MAYRILLFMREGVSLSYGEKADFLSSFSEHAALRAPNTYEENVRSEDFEEEIKSKGMSELSLSQIPPFRIQILFIEDWPRLR